MLRDRVDAGARLAQMLRSYTSAPRTMVVGLPRGGVVVAAEIARILHLPLDACIVRKLGVPWQPELAFGAIASGGVRILHQDLIRECGLSVEEINRVTFLEDQELQRRERLYCGPRPSPDYRGWQIILADDGIATGATLEAAIDSLRHRGASRIIVAASVAPPEALAHFRQLAEEVVVALTPEAMGAIGCWYDSFPQTTDEEVITLLRNSSPPRDHERQPQQP
ncbi:MAG: phosphoribosyltransferase [Acidobacteria bacterium]|nr:phosphoribosyltransferase [Acidobacteriota bacterium]